MMIESTEIEGIYRHTIDYVLRSVKRMQKRGDPGNICAGLIEVNCNCAIEDAEAASKQGDIVAKEKAILEDALVRILNIKGTKRATSKGLYVMAMIDCFNIAEKALKETGHEN